MTTAAYDGYRALPAQAQSAAAPSPAPTTMRVRVARPTFAVRLAPPPTTLDAPLDASPRDTSCLARAGLAYVVLEVFAAWGWLHWRADLPMLAPPLAVTMLMRGAFLLLFVSAIAQAGSRGRSEAHARDAACVGVASLLLHAPWTLIVLRWPDLAGLWLAAMATAAIVTTARLGRDRPSAALIAAPYTAWLVCAVLVDVIAARGRG